MKKLLLILLCFPFIGFGQIWGTELLKNNKDATFLEKKITFENYRTKYPDNRKNSLLFYLYDDGTVEKRIVIE